MTVWPTELVVRPLSKDDAKAVAGWRYTGPWAVYDLHGDGLDPVGYRAVVSAGDCELGIGMNPGWIGHGHGAAFARAVLGDIRSEYPGTAIRAVIQSWNRRSVRLAERLGFVATGNHTSFQDGREVEYTVLEQ